MLRMERGRTAPLPGDPGLALLLAAFALAATAFAPQLLNDGDTFWHIRAGEWMLDHRAILNFDPFSYTFAGKPWTTHEWLAEIALATVWRTGGWSAVLLLTASAFAAAAGVLAYHLSRFVDRATTCVASLLALASVSPSLLARPHMLALPLLALWTGALALARSRRTTPSLWLLPVMSLWANLHASFVVGLALVVVFAVEAVTEERSRIALRRWMVFGAASFAAALATPHGLFGLLFPLQLNAMPALRFVGEWQPTGLSHLEPFEVGLGAALYMMITRRVSVGILRGAALAGLTVLACLHSRHQMLLGIVAPFLLAEPLGAALRVEPRRGTTRVAAFAAAAFLVIFVTVGLRLATPFRPKDGSAAPITALAHVPITLARQPVLNDYAFGGYLIFERVKPFIDSRAELYGDDWIEAYARLEQAPPSDAQATLDARHVEWTVLGASNPLVRTIDGLPGWTRLYADQWAVVQVRRYALAREAKLASAGLP